MHEYAGMRNMDLWYDRIDIEEILAQFTAQATAEQKKRLDKNVAKARTKDSLSAFNKLTETVDGEPRIVGNPPLIIADGRASPAAPRRRRFTTRSSR